VRAAIAAKLPADAEALTGEAITAEEQSNIRGELGFFNIFLLTFAGIAIFVGSFIIYNTFSIIVAQRTREMALMRAIGASRRQVLGSVLLEALVVGLIAGCGRAAAGIGVASGLKAMLAGFGIELPAGDMVISARTVVVSMLVGVLVSIASAVLPARRSSKIPPVAAMRDSAVEPRGQSRWRVLAGLLVTAGGGGLLGYGLVGDADQPAAMVGLGAAVVFVGVTVLGPVIARPVSRLIGAPLPRVRGMAGTLARENAMRNPKRTASTAAALMIGVGLVGFITIAASSTKASVNASVDRDFNGDFVIQTKSFGDVGLSPRLTKDVGALPEVGGRLADPLARGRRQRLGGGADCHRPRDVREIADVDVTQGSLSELGGETIAVVESVAEEQGWRLGDAVPVQFAGGEQPLRIAAIFSKADVMGRFLIGMQTFEENADSRVDALVFATKAPGVKRGDRAGGHRAGHRGVPERRDAEPVAVQGVGRGRDRLDAQPDLRPARPGGPHRAARDHQHVGPVGRGADAGARAAAGGRHDAAAAAQHGPLGVGDRRAARHGARSDRRPVLRLGHGPGARGPGASPSSTCRSPGWRS
jgi:putative ABC transport system permease protein